MKISKTKHPITRRIKKIPIVNMIRDHQIATLGTDAVKNDAVIALIIYETSDGQIILVSHDETQSTTRGLLMNACEKLGINKQE